MPDIFTFVISFDYDNSITTSSFVLIQLCGVFSDNV